MARYKEGDYVRYVGTQKDFVLSGGPCMVMSVEPHNWKSWYSIRRVGDWGSFYVPESEIDDYSPDPSWDKERL